MRIKVKNSGFIELKKISDYPDGNLSIMEELRDIPFEIRRVFYINNFKNRISVRGKHAHKKLSQVIFCISGSFTLTLEDGENIQEIHLAKDNLGVLIGPGLWHTMSNFSSECVLLVVASDYYGESDYIRDYDQFKRWLKDHKE